MLNFYTFTIFIFSYLLGSIPTSYLAARWVKGIDLRRYGSGTVSGSMLYEHTERWIVVPVGLFDIAKGAFPVWMALQLGASGTSAAIAGLATVVGHNWPIYLGFIGGRGLSPFLGILLVMFPWGAGWLLVFLAVGFVLGDSAPFALVSLVTLPIFAWWLNASELIYWISASMLFITLLKRLEANRRQLPVSAHERRRVICRRLVFDRDIQDHKTWIQRKM
jgi:glycerol-3-phosphate acyltransferase PlsY